MSISDIRAAAGNGCCPEQKVRYQSNRPNIPSPCEPETCPDGVPKVCHCYFDDFSQMFSQFECLGEDGICLVLKSADCFTAGMIVECQRKQATLFMAAHLAEINRVALSESASRNAAMASGALARPAAQADFDAWLGTTIFGQSYAAIASLNPRLGMTVIY